MQDLGLKQLTQFLDKAWTVLAREEAPCGGATHTPEPLQTRTGAPCSKEIFRHMLPLVHAWSSTWSSARQQALRAASDQGMSSEDSPLHGREAHLCIQ